MAAVALASDEERLPWLEPYRDDRVRNVPVAATAIGRLPMVIAWLLAVVAAVSAGLWLGKHAWSPADWSIAKVEQSVTPVSDGTTTFTPAPTAPFERVASPPSVESAPASVAPVKAVSSSTRTTSRTALALKRRAPAKMASPGDAGQIVQLGAFGSAARAQAAYQRRIARYPLLGSMPRAVVRVVTKPDGQVLYALRIGTASRQQSGIVCRNLKASGDHCLVIG